MSKHKLTELLTAHQPTKPTQRDWARLFTGKREWGRNDPCPCGSGKKFKRCCVDLETLVKTSKTKEKNND